MSQQSLFIADGGGSNNTTSVTAANNPDGGFSLQGLVAQYNSSAPTLTSGNLTFLQTDVNGNLKISGTISSTDLDATTPGSAVPSQTGWIGASDGTNLQGLRVESSSFFNLRVGLYQGANEAAITPYNTALGNAIQVMDGYYASVLPTLTSGSASFLAIDVNSRMLVVGAAANGSAASGAPVLAAGWDGTNARTLNTTLTNSAATYALQSLVAQYNSSGSESTLTGPVDGYSFSGVPLVTNGRVTFAQTDGYGRVEVAGARAAAFAYENRASQTVTLKTSAGVLRKVIVGNFGASGALITFYDNTVGSGTVIAKINTSSVLGQLVYDIPFVNGLTYTTSSKAPGDITLTFE